MGVKEDLQTLIDNMKAYRETLLNQYDTLMRKTESKSRLIVDKWETLLSAVNFEVKQVIGNKYLTPPLTLNQITYPKFNYVGATFAYGLPKTVRNYTLPALPFFEYDMNKIYELIKHGDMLPIKNLFLIKMPKDLEIEGDFEDTHWKYIMVKDVYQPWISDSEKDLSMYTYRDFLNIKGQHLQAVRVLSNHEVKYYYHDTYNWVYIWIFSGQVELYCYDTDEYYTIDGAFVELSPTGLYTGYPFLWHCGDKKLHSLNVLIVKTEKGIDVIELRTNQEISNIKSSRMMEVIQRTLPAGFIGISMYGESIYSRRLETVPLQLT